MLGCRQDRRRSADGPGGTARAGDRRRTRHRHRDRPRADRCRRAGDGARPQRGGAEAFALADVTDAKAMADALEGAAAALGPFGILVNNAGAADSAPFGRTDRALWDRMLAVNLTSVFETTRIVLPGMLRDGWGRVINIASTAGLA